MQRGSRVTAGLTALLLVAAACGGDNKGGAATGTTASSSSATTAKSAASGGSGSASTTAASRAGVDGVPCTPDKAGGRITIGVPADAAGLDPAQVTGAAAATGGTQMAALYDTMMRWNPVDAKFEPQLAQSLTSNADASVWTLKLRPNVKFASGNPLDADAVVASIKRLLTANVAITTTAKQIADMKVVDPLTLQLTLTAPWGDFPFFFASAGGMIVDAKVAASMTPQQFNLNPVGAGAGPYTLERFAPGDEVLMKAKDDYWEGPVCIKEVRFITLANEQQALDTLKLGEVDTTMLFDPKVQSDAKAAGFPGVGEVTQVLQILINNRPGAPGHDLRVRQAIALALDLNLINQRIYDGKAAMGSTMLLPDDPLYTKDMVGPTYDAAKAKQLVADAKAAGWNGKIRLNYGDTSPDEATLVQGMLQAVGMDVSVRLLKTTDLVSQVTTANDYDLSSWSLNVLTSALWARLDTNLRSDSPTNRAGYADPRADAALLELRAATTPQAKSAAMAKLQAVYTETMPGALMRHNLGEVVWGKKVHGLRTSLQAVPLLDQATIDH
jgi:peptide/nickel transport system substrate-binding protein